MRLESKANAGRSLGSHASGILGIPCLVGKNHISSGFVWMKRYCPLMQAMTKSEVDSTFWGKKFPPDSFRCPRNRILYP
jgi:hypothetical protein